MLKDALDSSKPFSAIRFGAVELSCLNNHEKIELGWKKKYKESFGILVELISDEDAATLMPEADDVELDKVIDAAIDRVLARKAS